MGREILYMPFIICFLSGCTVFFHIVSQKTRFFRKMVIEHNMFVRFSRLLSFETCLTLRGIQRNVTRNMRKSSCTVTVVVVTF